MAGVVGIDIPVSRFEAFAPKSHLGPLGYPFAINTNGFLIFHPNLWMIANYLEDPAHNVSQLIRCVTIICRNDELSWLFTNRLSATR